MSFKNFAMFFLCILVAGSQLRGATGTVKMLECENGKVIGSEELDKSVGSAAEECKGVKSSPKNNAVRCFLVKLDMFSEDGRIKPDKMKDFFKNLKDSRLAKDAKVFMEQVGTCTANYAKASVGSSNMEVELGFIKCFWDATVKLTTSAREDCTAAKVNP